MGDPVRLTNAVQISVQDPVHNDDNSEAGEHPAHVAESEQAALDLSRLILKFSGVFDFPVFVNLHVMVEDENDVDNCDAGTNEADCWR